MPLLLLLLYCTTGKATKEAFVLILSNLARMGTATAVSNLVILLGRLVIVVGSTAACFVLVGITATGDSAPSSELFPCLVVTLASWFVSGCFMNVYGLAIDTIMVSFCEDDKYNDGASKPYYMSKGLLKIIGKKNKKGKGASGDDSSVEQTPVEEFKAPADEGGGPMRTKKRCAAAGI